VYFSAKQLIEGFFLVFNICFVFLQIVFFVSPQLEVLAFANCSPLALAALRVSLEVQQSLLSVVI
jgi:hypothetical protein